MLANNRLCECRELIYILIGDLRDLLEEAPGTENQRWLNAVLDTLLEIIPEEFALKSDHGYLSSVLDDFPNWEDEVNRLEDEYFMLYRQLLRLRLMLRHVHRDRHIAREISQELKGWMSAFRQHIQSEQKLVLLAANLEVGGGD